MDAIERIEQATEQCQLAVDGISGDQMGNATPCSEFTVRDLLNHVLWGLEMLTTAATTGTAVTPEGDIVSDDPAAQYAEGRAKLLAALGEPDVLEKTWGMPFGQMPGKMMAGIAFMEHLTHAWDLRKATGQPTELPDAIVNECIELVTPMDGMLRMPGVCGPAVEVGEDATPTEKLVAFMGRQP